MAAWHFCLLALHVAAAAWRDGLCSAVKGNTCVVTGNRSIPREQKVRWSGNVEFRGAWWLCSSRIGNYDSVRIDIAIPGTLSLLEGSLLHCGTVSIQARTVIISDTSEISTNGTSHNPEPTNIASDVASKLWSSAQRGASHGGLGGTVAGCSGEDAQLQKRLSLVYGDPFAPWQFGRSAGGGSGKRSAGGGRLRVISESLVLNGTLSASGIAPDDADDDDEGPACGSGGSIWISSSIISQPSSPPAAVGNTGEVDFVEDLGSGASSVQKGRVLAVGGCCRRCLCGGGGRVLTEVSSGTIPRNVIVAGGCFRDALKMDGEGCRCGSAGTWTFHVGATPGAGKRRRLTAPSRHSWNPFGKDKHATSQQSIGGSVYTVRVDNSYAVHLAGAKLPQPTPLPVFPAPIALQVNDALVVPSDQDATWPLAGLALLSDQTGSTLKHLGAGPLLLNFSQENDGLELAFSSIIQAREIRIIGAKHITLRQNAAIDASVASLEAAEEINAHQGALGQGEGIFSLRAQRVLLGSGRLRAASIVVEQDLVLKRGSRLQSSQRRCDQLPTALTDPCGTLLAAMPFQNQTLADNVSFDIVLASRQGSIVVEEDAEMYAGAFLLCGTSNISVRGLVSAHGLGCAPNRGEGFGAAPQQENTQRMKRSAEGVCGGGGGGHCGNGGDGVSNRTRQRCAGTGGLKYDGWWTSEVARSAKPSRLPSWSASGGGGNTAGAGGGIIWIRAAVLEMPSNSTSISASGEDASSWADGGHEGSGGGAGGTVIINATVINGSGMIKAAGGRGGGCVGGGGGGGAIGSAGTNASEAWAAFTGSLDVQGGSGDVSLFCGRLVGQRGCAGELLQLGVCRPGRAGIYCAECAAGTYNPPQVPENLTALFRICLPCKNKPTQGYYTTTGWLNESCPYACPSGFPPVEVNPDCDDPWSYYFAFFGGVWGVVVLILLMAVSFGLLISAKRVQTRRRLQWLQKQRHTGRQFLGMNDEAMLLFESLRGRHPLADLDIGGDGAVHANVDAVNSLRSRTVGESRPRWFLGYVASIWRKIRQRNRRGSDMKEAHLLNVGDLPHHTQRIYLQGENSPRDPWRLTAQPPEELRGLVDENRWADFAAQVNFRCFVRMRSQLMAEGVLRWLYLPVAEYIRWHLRFSRAADVAAYVWSLSEATGANETLWSLSIPNPSRYGLKFGTDREMTLAYVDVLDYSKTLEDWAIKPDLPMVITVAGDGEYTAPYHLDYADPFVQSVGQYLGRRIWHQVLLPFNLLARLLPPNPTEEDLRPLFRSMQRVSSRVLLQTDIECHAVLFESLVPKTSHKVGRRRPGPDATPVGRQSSWDIHVEAAMQIESNRTSISGLNNSELKTPSGILTPTQPVEHNMRRRLALVLTQRSHHPSASSRLSAPPSTAKLRAVMPAPLACLVSPTECLNFVQHSPGFCPSPMPDVPELPELMELERGGSSTYQDFDSMLRQRSSGRGGPALNVAFRDCGWSGESEPLSPQTTEGALADSGAEEPPRRRRAKSRCRCCQRLLPLFAEVGGAFCVSFVQNVEAALYFVAAPGNHVYNWYLRKLKAFNAIGGVGRQPGLYLRHRKPRGSQEYTLLMLMLTLAIATLGFIAQSAILFRLQPRHSAFFAALLLPPFADLLALVNTILFLCGAADGTTCCLFVVASNWNSAIGLLYRVMAMDTWRSSGLLHVLVEYLIVFSVKVSMCRLVNMTIAYYEAEPALLEPGGDDADHEWVKEHVLFRPAVRSMRERARTLTSRPPPLEEGYAEQNSRSWLMKGLDSTRSEHRPLAALISDISEHKEQEQGGQPSPTNKRSPRLGEQAMVSGDSVSDGWTPLLKQVSSSKPSFHFDRTESPEPT